MFIINSARKRQILYGVLLAALVVVSICYGFLKSDIAGFGGEYTVFIVDLYRQYTAFREYFANSSFLEKFFSFTKGMGEQTVGLNAYYNLSPFNFLLLLFPLEKINIAFCVVIICKFIFMAESMYRYMNSHYDNSFVNMVFGFCYAMYPNLIRNYHNILWLDAIALFPLVVLGTEKLIEGKGKKLFIAVYTFSLLSNYYITAIGSLYIFIYFFFYYITNRKAEITDLFVKIKDMAVSVVCSICFAAPVLLPAFMYLMQGKLISGDASDWHMARRMNPLNIPFALFERFFINNEFPQLAGSAAFVCLLFAFFINKKTDIKTRLSGGVLFAIMLLTLTSRPGAFIATGFSTPAGHFFRNIFTYAFTLLILGRTGYEYTDKTGGRIMSVVTALLSAGAAVYFKVFNYLPFTKSGLILTAISFIVCAVCFCFFDKKQSKNLLCIYIIAITVVNTGFYISSEIYGSRPRHNVTNSEFVNKITAVKTAADSIDDNGFYRVEDTDKYDFNQGMLADYNSLSYFSSDYSEYVYILSKHFGFYDAFYGTAYRHRLLTDSLFGVKYLFSDDDMTHIYTPYSPDTEGLYRNPYALPVFFTGDTHTVEYSDNYETHINNMFTAFSGISVIDDYGVNTDKLKAAADSINSRSAQIVKVDGALVKLKAKGGYLLTTVPYNTDWKVYVNGNRVQTEKFMDYFIAAPLNSNDEVDITMLYVPRGMITGFALCLSAVVITTVINIRKKKYK